MKVICVLVPHFPLAVERRERPDLRVKPVIIGGYPHERGTRVLDASEECLKAGVTLGMPLRQAHELCASVFLPADEDRYRAAFETMLAILENFSPAVEPAESGCVYVDATGLTGLHGDDNSLTSKIAAALLASLGLEAQIGLGSGKFIARLAASLTKPGQPFVVPIVSQRDFLNPLPVTWLPLSADTQEKLKLLGLHEIGQLARLPRTAVAQRFGPEGTLAHRLANGDDDREVKPRPQGEILERSVEFEPPLETVEQLVLSLNPLLGELCQELRSSQRTFQTLTLWGGLPGGQRKRLTNHLHRPTSDERAVQEAFQELAGRLLAYGPVMSAGVSLGTLGKEKGRQFGLFEGQEAADRRRQAIMKAAQEINLRFGDRLKEKAVSAVPLLNATRVRLLNRGGQLFLIRGNQRESVAKVYNRWKIEEWWPKEICRHYLLVQTGGGTVCTVYYDKSEGNWFMTSRLD
jgi:DNA polymerase-4